ncbi:MAG: 30S ribosomal protein S8 [Parcubacteria group bacterium RIFCSPLOWO2_01_FULL_40_65]|nr:ribosomal protein S8 [uncultured bacterium]OHB17688.1 MAG: 30S ribosomal protein S8 [Parcubacteria group bacterium RIFCSPHIGHO2_01_FULL_40_30]OHB19866.1 MAG: 30S ribosomal protein S8 [Parcubacteria group bacterium RIFCSPHIGHO2_02_FULL_40_12]OHB21577.1 MAG: 30S ribosomal protein S8 [Parcubacteria group bacterium RIFCSPLOWO2_01_FULL_40_65]OHB23497.1 MAG: 30S ribosomal protein S8 [Parcubacteria group bacterium RIFCSPLOWO2_02_FULL_40_12]OHB24028.1 MAG: 30S ribosomal protein S8 [Parcubacteria gr
MDTISDFFIRIKNAYLVKKDRVVIPFSKMKYEMAKILEQKGFVSAIRKKKKVKKAGFEQLFLDLKLKYNDTVPLFENVKLISRPGRRIYLNKNEIKPVREGYGILILSTSKGIMTGEEAKKMGLGGQAIAEIW